MGAHDGDVKSRQVALGFVAAGLVAVVLLAAVPVAGGSRSGGHAAGSARAAPHVPPALPAAPDGWVRTGSADATYAVPPGWQTARGPIAYREDGRVIAAGSAMSTSSAQSCVATDGGVARSAPVAWAALAEPVESTNPRGVAVATVLAWARGYAGLPASALERPRTRVVELADGRRAQSARVVLDLGGGGPGCATGRAEITAVSARAGGRVDSLVVARRLGGRATLTPAARASELGSLEVR